MMLNLGFQRPEVLSGEDSSRSESQDSSGSWFPSSGTLDALKYKKK